MRSVTRGLARALISRSSGYKNSNSENRTSAMRSVTRGLASALISRSSGYWNTARTLTPSGHVAFNAPVLCILGVNRDLTSQQPTANRQG